jgi:hypothetical protein
MVQPRWLWTRALHAAHGLLAVDAARNGMHAAAPRLPMACILPMDRQARRARRAVVSCTLPPLACMLLWIAARGGRLTASIALEEVAQIQVSKAAGEAGEEAAPIQVLRKG